MGWDGWGPGMSGEPVAKVKTIIKARFSYGKKLSEGPDYLDTDVAPIAEYQRRIHAEILAGKRQPPDPRTDGRIDWATQVQLGVIMPGPSSPPIPKNRHLAVVYRGTGGIIGQDLVSLVCQASADLVEEINPDWPATMGGFPVGTAGGLGDVSMNHAVQVGLAAGQQVILDALRINPKRKVIIGGYSAGAVVAALLRQWLLATFPDNYLCSFSFGDPTRPAGGCYYGGVPAPGRGISSWHFGDITDWRHCWLVTHGDMYGSVPDNAVGDIMDTAYEMITAVQLSDPLGTAQAILPKIPVIMAEAGVSLPTIFNGLMGGPASLITMGLPLIMGGLQGLIAGATGNTGANLTGPAAAAQAALIALQFVTAQPPTAPHVEYHLREVWPGQTYLGLGCQHVRDWSSRVIPAAA